MRQAPQELIDGRYQLEGELGRGGIGTVYRAREVATGREVALKLLPAGHLKPRQRERFLREGQASAAMDHPGIVRVHAYGEWQARPFLVYELIEGARTLDEAFEEQSREERVATLIEAARALGYAHEQGVIHRDVKPGNILVDSEGRPRVTDFGLALSADEHDRLTRTGELVGTPSYMAPEQLAGKAAAQTPATDVWALGVILYQALTDELPFDGRNIFELAGAVAAGRPTPPSKRSSEVSRGLQAVCLRALQSDPARRYPDATAFAAALASPADQVPRRGAALAAVLGLGLGLGALLIWAFAGEPPRPVAELPGEEPTGQPVVPREQDVSSPGLEKILSSEPSAAQLAALEGWLEENSDDPRRSRAEARMRQLRYDVPLARVAEGMPLMNPGVFIDEDTLYVPTDEPALWRLKDGSLRPKRFPGGLPAGERIEILARPGSFVCDVLFHKRNEPSRIFRERPLREVFLAGLRTFRFKPNFDLGLDAELKGWTKRRSISRNLLQVRSRTVDGQALFALTEDEGSLRGRLVRHRPGGAVEPVWSADYGPERDLNAYKLSPRGSYLALATEEPSKLHLINAATGALVWSVPITNSATCLAFSPDEGSLAMGTAAEMIFLFDLPGDGSGRSLQRAEKDSTVTGVVGRAHEATVRGLAFSADGRTLVSSACRVSGRQRENELRCWDVASGQDLAEWFRWDLPRPPFWLAVSPSGRRLAVGGRSGWFEVRRFVPAER